MENKICPFLLMAWVLASGGFKEGYSCIERCAIWDSERGCCGLVARDINVLRKKAEQEEPDRADCTDCDGEKGCWDCDLDHYMGEEDCE